MASLQLLSLPRDILILLPEYIHNIEDYTNFSSTCRTLRERMSNATPNQILRLAAAQSSTFFRPSPHFLVTSTAKELGHWARESSENEAVLATRLEDGIDGLLDLALKHCGLTMERIREMHLQRFSIINPVTDVIDKCVGDQWYATPDFWNGGVDDAYTIDSDPPSTLFHLALYGELFGPDFETFLNPSDATVRRLSVGTRLEFVKYCIPDWATYRAESARGVEMPDGSIDSRRAVKATGPYIGGEDSINAQNNLALVWVLQSSRWLPHWQAARAKAEVSDFQPDFKESWWPVPEDDVEQNWRQRLLESVMVCQGLRGLGMIRSDLQDEWIENIKAWHERIASLETEPERIKVGSQATYGYPFLLGDLSICSTGFVVGT